MKKIIKWKNKTAKKEYLKTLVANTDRIALSYSKEQNYEVGDYIKHFKFGPGFVQKVMGHQKIEVFFEGFEKVMLQNW